MSNQRNLKAFVRYDGSGRVVAGSLVLRKKKPKVGRWEEILTYECCNDVPSTTTSTTTQGGSTTSTTTTIAVNSCPTLGRAASFGVLGASTVTNTGSSSISVDLGLYPGTSVTGFPPGTVSGTQQVANTAAQNAQIDAQSAFTALNNLTPIGSLGADIGETTITPGIYNVSSSLTVTGTVVLDGQGNSNSVFIFQIPSTFILSTGAQVSLINGAQAGNVYWIVGSSATLGTSSNTKGNIIAQSSITFNTFAGLESGRAIALTGAVTLDTSFINSSNATCTVNPISGGTTTTTSTTTQSVTQWSTNVWQGYVNACTNPPGIIGNVYTSSNTVGIGTLLWEDSQLTIPYSPGSGYGYIKFVGNNTLYVFDQSPETTTIINTDTCE